MDTSHGTAQDSRKLIELAKLGEKEAFAILYELYFTPVFRYVYFRTNDRALAEDLVQDIFIKVYKSLDRFEIRDTAPLAYFFTVARNTIIDHTRKKKEILFEGSMSDEHLATHDEHSDTENRLTAESAYKKVQEVMEMLTEDQREVITLKFIGEQSTKEIAISLGKTEEAVRQLQSRALRELRTLCKNI